MASLVINGKPVQIEIEDEFETLELIQQIEERDDENGEPTD